MRIAVCLLCLFVVSVSSTGLFDVVKETQEIETVSVAKQAAERLLSAIRSKQFAVVLDLIGTVGGPVAGSVTSILKLVIGSGEDETLEFAREAFNEINNKLESFTNEFNEVKSMIDWSAVQISFGTYERSIRALKSQLKTLVDAPAVSTDHFRQMFIIKFESSFQNAAEKIYDAIINDDMIFSSNLLEASAKFTKNHRKNVQMFGMGLTQLLLQAIEINMAYVDLKFSTDETTNHMRRKWDQQLLVLKAKLKSFDETVKSRGTRQLNEDAERLRLQYRDLPSYDFVRKLYDYMKEKFFWKDVIVTAYDSVEGESKHSMEVCNGYKSLNRDGKNVLVASVDADESTFDWFEAYRIIQSLEPTEKDAAHILEVFNSAAVDSGRCKDHRLSLVAVASSNVQVASTSFSAIMEELCVSTFWGTTCYSILLFG